MTFEYLVFPVDLINGMFDGLARLNPDSYLAEDLDMQPVRQALAAGFRWIRTDGEWAVFELGVQRTPEVMQNVQDSG